MDEIKWISPRPFALDIVDLKHTVGRRPAHWRGEYIHAANGRWTISATPYSIWSVVWEKLLPDGYMSAMSLGRLALSSRFHEKARSLDLPRPAAMAGSNVQNLLSFHI